MKRRVGALYQTADSCIETYLLFFARNVSTIESISDVDESFGWLVEENNSESTDNPPYFLYIDGKHDDPFGHWVFECAIHLPLFLLLKKRYPAIKLLSLNPKKYKEIFYKGFSLTPDDLADTLPTHNTVIFTQWNSLGDHNPIKRVRFQKHLRNFYDHLTESLEGIQKDIDFLYLPRGTKENFRSNDRLIPPQQELLEIIPQLIDNSMIYYTDETSNILDQIKIVRRAKVVLLDYGSSLLVNGFFAENTTIFVLGDFGHIHCKNPKPYILLQESLKRNNVYYYLPVGEEASSLLPYIRSLLLSNAPPFQHQCICWKSCEHCSYLI